MYIEQKYLNLVSAQLSRFKKTNDFLWNLGLLTLWLAAIITLLSGYNYVAKGLKHI